MCFGDNDNIILSRADFQNCAMCKYYRAFHGFGQAKFPDGGSVLGWIQFSILLQLPPKMMLN